MKNMIMYKNLRAEMARKNLTIKDLSEFMGVNRDTLGRKLSMKSPITLKEAFQIQRNFFPTENVRHLFLEAVPNSDPKGSVEEATQPQAG